MYVLLNSNASTMYILLVAGKRLWEEDGKNPETDPVGSEIIYDNVSRPFLYAQPGDYAIVYVSGSHKAAPHKCAITSIYRVKNKDVDKRTIVFEKYGNVDLIDALKYQNLCQDSVLCEMNAVRGNFQSQMYRIEKEYFDRILSAGTAWYLPQNFIYDVDKYLNLQAIIDLKKLIYDHTLLVDEKTTESYMKSIRQLFQKKFLSNRDSGIKELPFPSLNFSPERKIREYPYWILEDNQQGLMMKLYHRFTDWVDRFPRLVEFSELRDLQSLCREAAFRWETKDAVVVLSEHQKKTIEDAYARIDESEDVFHVRDVLLEILETLRRYAYQTSVMGTFHGKGNSGIVTIYPLNILDAFEELDGDLRHYFDYDDYYRDVLAHELFHCFHYQLSYATHQDSEDYWFASDEPSVRSTVKECLASYFEVLWLSQCWNEDCIQALVLTKGEKIDFPAWPYSAVRACQLPRLVTGKRMSGGGYANPLSIFTNSLKDWDLAYREIVKGAPPKH